MNSQSINSSNANSPNIYDVNSYTQSELYSILDLNNPTDRELEAKIVMNIKKYENTNIKLYKFFNDIYGHFFELEDEEDNYENRTEGFELLNQQEGFDVSFNGFEASYSTGFEDASNGISSTQPTVFKPSSQAISDPIYTAVNLAPKSGTSPDASFNIGTQDLATIGSTQLGYTTNFNFPKGNLNPLLKETIKRIISIDSQFRDIGTFPLSTCFTFNLSDTLIGVVSLKLYSVQIPYTWYTINNNFGSNFFYIKGISPGIDDGNSDYIFTIPSGTYTAIQLYTAVNTAIANATANLIEVDLTTTQINYNAINTKCTFNINIVKRYNDINYELDFPYWTDPNNNSNELDTTQTKYLNTRFDSIPGFLGLLNQNYETYTIYSIPTQVDTNNNTILLTSINNTFTVAFYTDTTGQTPYTGSSTPPLLIPTLTQTITMQNSVNQTYSISSILQFINTGFASNAILAGSTITQNIFDTNNYNATNSILSPTTNYQYKIKIKINRQHLAFYDGMKAILQFPNQPVWLSSTGLNFKNSINELNNIMSEIDTPTTSYAVLNSPYIYLKCNAPYYGNTGNKYYMIDDIVYDISYNPQYYNTTTPIADLIADNIYTNTNASPNTISIYPQTNSPYYIGLGNYIILGDEHTVQNQTMNITSGEMDISGNNYTVFSSNTYTVSGNALISSLTFVNAPNPSQTNITSSGVYSINGTDYSIIGNTIIQGNLNIIKGNTQITYGSIDICNNLTPGGYYILGNSFLTGTTFSGDANILSGNAIIGSSSVNPSFHIIGNTQITENNFILSGNTNIQGSINLTGTTNVYNLQSATIAGSPIITQIPPNINPVSSLYSGNFILSGTNYNINSATNYFVYGQDTYLDQPKSIQVNGQTKIYQGNASIISTGPDYKITSATTYLMDGNINLFGNIHCNIPQTVNANIQIYSTHFYNISGSEYTILNDTLNINGNTQIVNYGNIKSSQNYTIQGIDYSILTPTNVKGNITANSGNLLIQSTNPYIIKGNRYTPTYDNTKITILGNTYIINGNSRITGNQYNVYGNIAVAQDTSYNDYIIDIANNPSYELPNYLETIQTGMQNCIGNTNLKNTGSSITIDTNNSLLHSSLKFNIQNIIDTSYTDTSNPSIRKHNYYIDLSGSYLYTKNPYFGLGLPDTIYSTITSTTSTSAFLVQGGGYIINDTNNKIVIYSTGPKNSKVPITTITLTTGTYASLDALAASINQKFTSNVGNYISMVGSSIQFIKDQTSTNTYNSIFTFNIKTTLTADNYSAYFYDNDLISNQIIPSRFGLPDIPKFYGHIVSKWNTDISNTWVNYLDIPNQYYNLTATYNEPTHSSYAEILGTDTIQSNNITLTDQTNTFYLKPCYDLSGGVYITQNNNDPTANDIQFTIRSGTYSKELLVSYINTAFQSDLRTVGSTISFITDPITFKQYTQIRLNMNANFTTKDFVLDFYDPVSFSTCNVGLSGKSSIQNVLWDTTLGWILGFRNTTQFYLTPENQTGTGATAYYDKFPSTLYLYNNNTASITGDTSISVFLYNYFMIILDDYVQNHLNDGLVTITNTDFSIPLPSYANRATFKCDPITQKPIATTAITNYNNLTAKQLYAANEILNVQQTNQSNYSSGPFVQDIFGIIPIKTTGMLPGQPYIEFGGSLQLQERSYFGPVNIRRMTIKLVNDKGAIVDLNGANWSFSLICEQLYSSATSKK